MKEESDVFRIKQLIKEYADEFENRTYLQFWSDYERFETADTVEELMFYVGSFEKLRVLKMIKQYCSIEDFAQILCTYWVAGPAGGKLRILKGLSTEEALSLFEGIPKELLRPDKGDGNTTIKELPDIITIYRVGRDCNRPSWSTDINRTKAFVCVGNEMLFSGNIRNDKIIAYFDFEEEVVVNPKDIFNLRKEGLARKLFPG